MNPTPKQKWYFHPLWIIFISIISPTLGMMFVFEAPITLYWKRFLLLFLLTYLILRMSLFFPQHY